MINTKSQMKINICWKKNFKEQTRIFYLTFPENLSQSIKEKCSSTGLWLFIYSVEELAKMV